VQAARTYAEALYDRLLPQFSTEAALWQLGYILLAGLIAWAVHRPLARRLTHTADQMDSAARFARLLRSLARLIMPALWAAGLWLGLALFAQAGQPDDLLRILTSLLAGWVLIRLVVSAGLNPVWARVLGVLIWAVAALNILRLLDPTIAFLDSLAITVGTARISVFLAIKAIAIAVLVVWLGTGLASWVEGKIGHAGQMTASARGLLGQLVRVLLILLALALGLSAIGIDVTALAVFTGAVGVGVGIGLQGLFSNFVAGLILLFERSVRVGDFVELEAGTRGQVRELNLRSTLITTNDNIDILIPNSEFINTRVTNWTMRDTVRRLRLDFGVAYGSDKEKVRAAGLQAAAQVSYTLTGVPGREPQVWLVGFGDSSLDFQLVVWLRDEATKRPAAVEAAYYWELETALAHHGIAIPFPQRDLHLVSPSDLKVTIAANQTPTPNK